MKRPKVRQILFAMIFAGGAIANAGPWIEHSTKYKALTTEISDLEHHLEHLVKKKNQSRSAVDIKAATDDIIGTYKKMVEKEKELDKLRRHVKFKHPDQAEDFVVTADGKKKKRTYGDRADITVEEIENEIGLDGRLDRMKKKVISIFPVVKSDEASTKAQREPAAVTPTPDPSKTFDQIKLVK